MAGRTFLAFASALLLAGVSFRGAPLQAQSLYDRALAAAERDQIDSAYALAELAAGAQPDRAEVQFLLGNLACAKAGTSGPIGAVGLVRKCKAALARAVEQAPDSIKYVATFASVLGHLPGVLGGDRDSAMTLAAWVQARDEVTGAFLYAGLWWTGDTTSKARADSAVAAVAARHTSEPRVQFRAAGWWAATNRPERALATYEALVDRDTSDAVARYFLGRQLVLMKREPRRAAGHLRFAATRKVPAPGIGVVTFTPGAPWYRLGQAYEQLAMPDSARLCFEEALRVNPRLDLARQSLDSLAGR